MPTRSPETRSWLLPHHCSPFCILDPNTRSNPSGRELGLGSPSSWNQSWFYNPLYYIGRTQNVWQASKQGASTHEMNKNHSSIVVLRIRPKFWWMLPMGVRDNRTKYEPETQHWRPETGVASARPPFQNLQFWAKIRFFFPETVLQRDKNGQMKGNSGYSTHAARLVHAEGRSRAL